MRYCDGDDGTHVQVSLLLLLVALLVGGGLGLIGSLLLLVEALPPLSEELANLACCIVSEGQRGCT